MHMADETKSRRDRALAELSRIEALLFSDKALDMPTPELRALQARYEQAKTQYFQSLPAVTVSRCPFDQKFVEKRVDVFGLAGPWWLATARDELPFGDDHVLTYTGALNLNGVGVSGLAPRDEILLGPGVPFVIPRLLAVPSVRCVIASLPIFGKATAYFMTYFANPPIPAWQSHQQWLRETFQFVDGTGSHWSVREDEWDVDLAQWLRKAPDKIFWIEPGDPQFRLVSGKGKKCPYVDLPGVRAMQRIQKGVVREYALPAGGAVAPFD
jgi:hypothetical protein